MSGIIRFKTTKQHSDYWKNRKIDWNQAYLSTWDHPHRTLLVQVLKTLPFISLWEVGCGPGANLMKIVKELGSKQLGGSDINADAIELARKTFANGRFKVESVDNLMMSDDSVDIVLSDATLLYYSPLRVKKAIKEMKRIGRNYIVLCELYEKNWLKRMWYALRKGYYMHDYKTLLEKENCYDIRVLKIPKQFWEGTPWEEHGYIIVASIIK